MAKEKCKIQVVYDYICKESVKLKEAAKKQEAQAEIYDDCATQLKWAIEQDGIDNQK